MRVAKQRADTGFRGCVKKDCVPIGSFIDNKAMGRPKNFNRKGVLKKALPVFWRRGFADVSLHELEVPSVFKTSLFTTFCEACSLNVWSRPQQEAAEKDFFNKEVAEFSEKGFPVPQKLRRSHPILALAISVFASSVTSCLGPLFSQPLVKLVPLTCGLDL